MTSRHGLAASLVLGAAILGGVLIARDGDGSAQVGLNSHLVWAAAGEPAGGFEEMRAGGVRWAREEGRFDWRQTDRLVEAASRAGVQLLGILAYSAPWASSDPEGDDGRYPPREAGAYARYAAAVVSRYGPGGSFWQEQDELDPQPLRAVEIWNEPWTHSTWRPDPDPAAYARLVRAAAAAIREVSPDVKIAIAGDLLQVRTDGTIVGWLSELLRADPSLPSVADVYSVHPYPDPRTVGPDEVRPDGRWDYGRIELLRRVDDSLPIWITEIGWSTADTDDSVTEETQADYVAGAIRREREQWSEYVERIFVYSFDPDSGDSGDREGHYGVLREDGSAKPSWAAVQQLSRD